MKLHKGPRRKPIGREETIWNVGGGFDYEYRIALKIPLYTKEKLRRVHFSDRNSKVMQEKDFQKALATQNELIKKLQEERAKIDKKKPPE